MKQWGCRTVALTEIKLYGNEGIIGSIPTEIGELERLRYFAATGARLTGSIPSELDTLASLGVLQTFQATYESLEGTVPPNLCTINSVLVECVGEQQCPTNCTGAIPP